MQEWDLKNKYYWMLIIDAKMYKHDINVAAS